MQGHLANRRRGVDKIRLREYICKTGGYFSEPCVFKSVQVFVVRRANFEVLFLRFSVRVAALPEELSFPGDWQREFSSGFWGVRMG